MGLVELEGALRDFEQAVNEANEFAGRLIAHTVASALDRYEAHGSSTAGELRDAGLRATSSNISIEVELRSGGSLLLVRTTRGGSTTIELLDGDLRSFSRSGNAIELERARDSGDLQGFLASLDAECPASVVTRVVNVPSESGFHWISSMDGIRHYLMDDWFAFANVIDAGPGLVIVGDMHGSVLETSGCRFLGPEALRSTGVSRPAPSLSIYRAPSPFLFTEPTWVNSQRPELEAGFPQVINGLAKLCIWHALASSVVKPTPELTVSIVGARAVTFTISPSVVQSLDSEVELLRWTSLEASATRLEFVRQALSLAILDGTDVDTAAGPALNTAHSLYQLSLEGSIAQALSARRSALEAVWTSSRTAGASARDFASKTTERIIVQIGVIAGILVAQVRDALSVRQAGFLLLTLGVLSVFSLLLSVQAIRGTESGFEAELDDLKQLRDIVADRDLEQMRGTTVVTSARRALRNAKRSAGLAYGAVGLAAVVAGLVLLLHTHSQPSPPLTPSQTATPR